MSYKQKNASSSTIFPKLRAFGIRITIFTEKNFVIGQIIKIKEKFL
jgi:hypothetical protein